MTYDAVCCRTWIMPLEALGLRGRCGYCGEEPEIVGNVQELPITQPHQYLDPTYQGDNA